MRYLQILFLLAVVSLGSAENVPATALRIIGNSSIKASGISADDLRRVFLVKINSLHDGSYVEPVLEKRGAVHEAFLKEYIGKTDATLSMYYRSLIFTGKGSMPKVLDSDEEVAAYVAKTRGAIGYVSATTKAPGTKAISVN